MEIHETHSYIFLVETEPEDKRVRLNSLGQYEREREQMSVSRKLDFEKGNENMDNKEMQQQIRNLVETVQSLKHASARSVQGECMLEMRERERFG